MGTLFLPAAQNDQEMQADLQSQLSPSVGRAYSQVYNFDVLEGFTGAMVKQHALNDIANTGEKLSVDQLRKEYTDGLVNFDRPLTRAQAELIRDRKREELQRQDIWQRAEGWATASGVTASLAAGVVDPVGTAVGIVMAPAKGIQMLAGLRAMAASSSLAYRALGTAGLTAVDAAIGNAILEPYNLYSHQQYYADYTMADSLANVVFGGVFGGAVGGGAVVLGRGLSHVGKWTPEWLKGKQEATHETALHTAVAQVLDGRPVQVEPILRSDPNLRMAEGHPVQAAEMAGPRVDEPIPTLTDVIHTQETEISKSADVVKPDRPVLTDIVQPLTPVKKSPPGRLHQHATAADLQAIVDRYTGGESMVINSSLAIDGHPSPHTAELVAKLDEYLARGRATKEATVVYRAAWDEAADAITPLKVGDVYHNRAYMSTATTKEAMKRILQEMEDFGPESQVNLEITLPAGKRWGRRVRDSSGYFHYQSEFLLDRSLEFKVTGIKPDGTVQLEALRRIRPDSIEVLSHVVSGPRVDEPAAALKPEPKYSPTEQENIARYYRQEGSSRINPELRSGKPSKEVLGYAQALDEWIQAGRAYAANKSVWRQAIDDEAKFLYGLKKGDTFTKDDFTSTFSTKKAFDYTWAGAAGPESGSPVIAVKIKLPKDTLVGRKMQYDSKNDVVSESEFLIRRNQKFEVTKVSDGQIELKLHNAPETPASMEFTAASGKEVLVQAKEHMEAPRTGAADDVAENFDAEIQAMHKDTAEYYEPAAKTRKMMELEKQIEYQQSRLAQEHGDVQVDGLKQADDALNKADDLRAAMVEGMACLLRR